MELLVGSFVGIFFSDVEAPKFTFCPSTILKGTDPGSNTSHVVWRIPTASDNSGATVTVTLEKGPSPGSQLGAGKYDIVYNATDLAGNTARDCSFSIIVKGATLVSFAFGKQENCV